MQTQKNNLMIFNKLSLNSADWFIIKDEQSKLSYKKISKQIELKNFDGKIKVPSNWELENHHNFNGTLWYIRYFEINTQIDLNSISNLNFYGIDYFADVWLNNNFLGHHEGYFQEFNFDITSSLQLNDVNLLVVKVTSPKETPGKIWPHKKQLIKGIFNHHDCRPGAWDLEKGQDQNTGGIWNDVEIILNQKIKIEQVKISSKIVDENLAQINISFKYLNKLSEKTTQKFSFEISTPDKRKIIVKRDILLNHEKGDQSILIDINNPKLWWTWDLGKPNLYQIKIKINSEILFSENFGIRNIELNTDQDFIINGKKLFLRGTNIIPEQMLSKLNSEMTKKIVSLIKEANVNAVRVHAHVNRKELYEEFDKVGILVWQDFALQWTYDISKKFTENAVRQIKEMVNQFYNHPSIAFWCCHNEPGEQIKSLDEKLCNAVKEEDTTRIIRLASNYEEHPYDGWYWGNKEHFAAAPMGPLVTEFGAQGIPCKKSLEKFIPKEKLYPPDLELWKYHDFQPDTTFNIAKIQMGNSLEEFIENSQSYQSDLLRTAIHFYRRKKNKNISGIFQFMFIDCWPSITWSIVDYYFEKKDSFNTLKECYEPLLLSVNLRQDQYFQNAKLNFDIYIINDFHKPIKNCSVKIFLNSKNIGKIENLDVEENSTLFIAFETMNIVIPKNVKAGNHDLEFKLQCNSKIISVNKLAIKVIRINS